MVAADRARGAGGLPAILEKRKTGRAGSGHARETASFCGSEDGENVNDHGRNAACGILEIVARLS